MSKRQVNRIFYYWILLVAIVALIGKVSVAAPNAGRTAADFLQVGIGARAAGMGGAFTAMADGVDAPFWNPAGAAGLEFKEFSIGHFSWYQDISLNHGSLAFPVNQSLGIALSATFVDYGKIDGYDQFGTSTGQLTAGDWAAGITFGYQFNEQFKAGLTGKYINQKLADVSASGFAGDLGLTFTISKFNISAMAANIGTTMKFETESEKLPSAVRLGVAYAPVQSMIVGSIEVEKKLYGDIVTRQGLELRFNDAYFLRSGLSFYPGQGDYRSMKTGYAVGAGVELKAIRVDYAFTPSSDLAADDLHRFSLGFKF
jgi:hypothetical protein